MNRALAPIFAVPLLLAATACGPELGAGGHPKDFVTTEVRACPSQNAVFFDLSIAYFGDVPGTGQCLQLAIEQTGATGSGLRRLPEGWSFGEAQMAKVACGDFFNRFRFEENERPALVQGSIEFIVPDDPQSAVLDVQFAPPPLSEKPTVWLAGPVTKTEERCPF